MACSLKVLFIAAAFLVTFIAVSAKDVPHTTNPMTTEVPGIGNGLQNLLQSLLPLFAGNSANRTDAPKPVQNSAMQMYAAMQAKMPGTLPPFPFKIQNMSNLDLGEISNVMSLDLDDILIGLLQRNISAIANALNGSYADVTKLYNQLSPMLGTTTNATTPTFQNVLKLLLRVAPYVLPKLSTVLYPNASLISESDAQCFDDLDFFLQDLLKGKMWAFKMLDAAGKPGPSIMEGNLKFMGNFDECLDITSRPVDGRTFHTDTCVVNIGLPPQLMGIITPQQMQLMPPTFAISWHVCVPDTCGHVPLNHTMQTALARLNLAVVSVDCHSEFKHGDVGGDPLAVGAISLTAVLMVLLLLGSVLDLSLRAKSCQGQKDEPKRMDAGKLNDVCVKLYNGTNGIRNEAFEPDLKSEQNREISEIELKDRSEMNGGTVIGNGSAHVIHNGKDERIKSETKRPNRAMWQRLLLCFSAFSNGEKILSVSATPGALTCLNGIRVLSIGWVIMGHTFIFLLGIADNPAEATELLQKLPFQILVSGTLSVDSFFVLSGVLVTYLFLRECDKAEGVTVKNMVMYYVHRYLRLTPAYAYSIFIYACLGFYMVDGPTWRGFTDMQVCKDNLWVNILYINNVYKTDQMCFAWSWYLANDMQFYFIAPLALVPLALARKKSMRTVMKGVGISVIISLILTGLIATWVINTKNPGDTLHNGFPGFFTNIYIKPWTRVSPYAIGMAVGYILYANKCKIHMSGFLQGLGWLVAFVLAAATTLSTYDEMAEGRPLWSDAARTAHQALFRPGWGLVVGWVILMCSVGKGGPVNWFLSWAWWQPLARLTYGSYLLHLIIIALMNSNIIRSLIHYSASYMVVHFMGYAVLSYIFAFILAILVEAPCLQLEKLLLAR